MEQITNDTITGTYMAFINDKAFPCVGAKAALAKQQVTCMVAEHMACPVHDRVILEFLYQYVDLYRASDPLFHSAAIIFKEPCTLTEDLFEDLLWKRLQALANLDAVNYGYDKRVNADPASPNFSFSLMEEAFFIIGLHPGSSRVSRRFQYPTLVFNPHAQFVKLRETNKYPGLKNASRKRDLLYSGSVNPMLEDFGTSSEVYQYSGRQYDQWSCPLHINHKKNEPDPTT